MGRAADLERLYGLLQQSQQVAITAIAGMGGIGKTELALQYAQYFAQGNAHLPIYPGGICWIHAHIPSVLESNFESKGLAEDVGSQIVAYAQTHLDVMPPDSMQNLLDRVSYCWKNWPEGDVLLVLDDVTDYAAIEPYLPPPLSRFKLLLTTRLELEAMPSLDIQVLSEAAALNLLQSLSEAGRIQAQLESAKTLCAWLGYLPLGLELVGRFLARQPDWSLTRLQRRLIEKRLDARSLCRTELGMTSIHETLAAAFELSWQELEAEAQQLGYLLSLFALAPIPWSLVEWCCPDQSPEVLEKLRDDQLVGSSLLRQVGEEAYQLHPLIRSFFQTKLQIETEQGAEWVNDLKHRAGVLSEHLELQKERKQLHPEE